MITGSALLVGMVYFFFPEYTTVVKGFAEVSSERGYAVSDFLGDLWLPVAETFKVIFHPHNFMTWSFWVFLYVAVSVSSHLAPSRVDMEGAWFGLGVILVPVLLLNGIAVALGWNFVEDLVGLYPYIGAVAGFFAVALGLSILNFGVSYAVAAAWYWYRHRILLSPL
jgi:hypothetical protein